MENQGAPIFSSSRRGISRYTLSAASDEVTCVEAPGIGL